MIKNILWIYNRPLNPEAGGTERITSLLINGFTKLGYSCVGLLVFDYKTSNISFEGKNVNDLYAFLLENRVDIVINQIAYETKLLEMFLVKGGQKWKDNGGKIISCLHFDPKNPSPFYFYKIKRNKTLNDWLTLLKLKFFFRYYEKKSDYQAGLIYREVYDKSDAFVLLSQTHFPYIKRVMQLNDSKKLFAINNPLTFPNISKPETLQNKKNVAIVVARMSEYHKRISIILKAWRMLSERRLTSLWVLKIIGDGADLPYYKQYVSKHHIDNVVFIGQANPEPYYDEAKLFFMTSSAEGWGLTLTESLQKGVVPVAMDSSTVFHEIISDGKDGFIVPNNDINAFVNTINRLMFDNELWRSMAEEGLRNAVKFSKDNTMKKWLSLASHLDN